MVQKWCRNGAVFLMARMFFEIVGIYGIRVGSAEISPLHLWRGDQGVRRNRLIRYIFNAAFFINSQAVLT
jgi:hypothetical protein